MQYSARHLKPVAPHRHSNIAKAAVTAALLPALMATPAFAATQIVIGVGSTAKTYQGGTAASGNGSGGGTWSWGGGESDALELYSYQGESITAQGDLTVDTKGTNSVLVGTLTASDEDVETPTTSDEDVESYNVAQVSSQDGSVTVTGGGSVTASNVSAAEGITVEKGTTLNAGSMNGSSITVQDSTLNAKMASSDKFTAENSTVDVSSTNKVAPEIEEDVYGSGFYGYGTYAVEDDKLVYLDDDDNPSETPTEPMPTITVDNSDVHFGGVNTGWSPIEMGATFSTQAKARDAAEQLAAGPSPTIVVNGITHNNPAANVRVQDVIGEYAPFVTYNFDLAAEDGSVTIKRGDKYPVPDELPKTSVELGGGELKIVPTTKVAENAKLQDTDLKVWNFEVTKTGSDATTVADDGFYTFTFNVGSQYAGKKATVYVQHDDGTNEVFPTVVDGDGNVMVKTNRLSIYTVIIHGDKTTDNKPADTDGNTTDAKPAVTKNDEAKPAARHMASAKATASTTSVALPETADPVNVGFPALLAMLGLVSVAGARYIKRD